MPEVSDRRLIFVVGSPRSGTTLLQNMLCLHPEISSAPETRIFSTLSRNFLNDQNHRPLLKYGFPRALTKQSVMAYGSRIGRTTDRTVLPAFSGIRGNAISVDQFILRIFDVLKRDDAKYFLEKTPLHIHYVREIKKAFPNAFIINVFRDPRATVHSMATMFSSQGKQRSIINRSLIWERAVASAIRQNLFSIYYESLVTNPELELRQMFDLLELEQPDKLDFEFEAQSRSTVLSREVWKKRNWGKVDATSLRRYESEMGSNDRRMVEVLCEKKMKRLGYRVRPATMTEVLSRWKNIGKFFGSFNIQ